MKIRTDFVTNSSSSSYIICIGKLIDHKKIDLYKDKKYIKILITSQIINSTKNQNMWSEWKYTTINKNPYITVENFSTSVHCPMDLSKEEVFMFINISNDEGDGAFWNEDLEYMNYNIEIDYFDVDQREALNLITESKDFKDTMLFYGAARNG